MRLYGDEVLEEEEEEEEDEALMVKVGGSLLIYHPEVTSLLCGKGLRIANTK